MAGGEPEDIGGLEDTASMPTNSRPNSVEPERHCRIGPYRLLHPIGEGGMGEVWVADQLEPVKRRVAVKVIKAGMDTKQVIARFEAERQALAMMDHPAIAKVLDAGATGEGRPYFVMEYVPGVSITEHCDTHRLPTENRLKLFIEVCEGVQHAHQKAIIHRDLKPSNILVSLVDGKPQPKIIDFGIAKATGLRLTDRTLVTEVGTVIGTPEYMSPEQADLTGQDIDTRTDVYSLGVILYELLTGALPFGSSELRSYSYEELRRKLREVDPPWPSSKLATLGEGAQEAARKRETDAGALRKQLEGDLDAIVMKALEKERGRRYGTAAEVAADLRRFLGHEPVVARPPDRLYRLGKYVRRHRVGVAVSTALVLLLAGFAAAMTFQARRIAAERDRADRQVEAGSRTAHLIFHMFDPAAQAESGDPARYREFAVHALRVAARSAEQELADYPDDLAHYLRTVGHQISSLGFQDEALTLFQRASEIHARAFGDANPKAFEYRELVADQLDQMGHISEAESAARALLRDRERALGDGSYDVLASLLQLGRFARQQGNLAGSEQLLKRAVALAEKIEPPGGHDRVHAMLSLSNTLSQLRRFDEAEEVQRAALNLSLKWRGVADETTLRARTSLAYTLSDRGKGSEAESQLRQLVEDVSRNSNVQPSERAEASYNLACILALQHKNAEAIHFLRDAVNYGLSRQPEEGLEGDPDLASLRSSPEFQELIKKQSSARK